MGRSVDTHQGGPNMPKYLQCPLCTRMAKRIKKSFTGARYKCPKHGEFFMQQGKREVVWQKAE